MVHGKTVEGVVLSNKMDKTAVVALQRVIRHPLYKKTLRRITRLVAHDEANVCNIGDKVRLSETRPVSKSKRWKIIEIIEAAK